jgi:hypothetical protein
MDPLEVLEKLSRAGARVGRISARRRAPTPRLAGAPLLNRVLARDVLRCPCGGGRRRVVAAHMRLAVAHAFCDDGGGNLTVTGPIAIRREPTT